MVPCGRVVDNALLMNVFIAVRPRDRVARGAFSTGLRLPHTGPDMRVASLRAVMFLVLFRFDRQAAYCLSR